MEAERAAAILELLELERKKVLEQRFEAAQRFVAAVRGRTWRVSVLHPDR
jgi:hypothetical protein